MSSSAIRSDGRTGPSSASEGAVGAISTVVVMGDLRSSDPERRPEMWRLDAILDPAQPTGWAGTGWLGTMTESSERVLNAGVIAVSTENPPGRIDRFHPWLPDMVGVQGRPTRLGRWE